MFTHKEHIKMSKTLLITNICRHHRQEILKISLKEMGVKTNTLYKTLSAFENGRSTNINHLIKYFEISDLKQRQNLALKIASVLIGG